MSEAKKPVTELWNSAFEVWDESDDQKRPGLARLGRAVMVLQDAAHGGLLEVLDLVATSNRLGLVRWAVGLDDKDIEMLRSVLVAASSNAGLSGKYAEAEGFQHLLLGLHDALAGGEGGAKEEPPVSGCPECEAGECGCPQPQRCPQHDRPQPCSSECPGSVASLSRILPAGKPPPFLRVGMKLETPNGVRAVASRPGCMRGYSKDAVLLALNGEIVGSALVEVALAWPLAEDFAVDVGDAREVERQLSEVREKSDGPMSPPMMERRKPCTCNGSPSPRRCEGQSKLGEGWYCVEGRP